MSEEQSPIESLLESVKHLFDTEQKSAFSDANVQLALTIMLVDLALVDNDFDDEEYRNIYHVLRGKLSLESPAAHELIEQARQIVRSGSEDIESFSVFLGQRLSKDEKDRIMTDFIEIMAADGTIHPFETNLKARYETLLGLKKK